MALVPFRYSGPSASEQQSLKIIQVGSQTLYLKQGTDGGTRSNACVSKSGAEELLEAPHSSSKKDLQNVGQLVWQSGFLLADFLLRNPPFKEWAQVRVLDLGSGTGIVGIALALAGAEAILADLPHICPLAKENLANNGLSDPQCQVIEYEWGTACPLASFEPDIITGGDLLYEAESHEALIRSLAEAAAAHTLIYLSFRVRDVGGVGFRHKLERKGFLVSEVDPENLHEEYRQQDLSLHGGKSCIGRYGIFVAQKLP